MAQIWIIANLYSGTKSKKDKENLRVQLKAIPNAAFFETQYANHGAELAQKALNEGIRHIVAVGGDGTLNEIGKVLVGTNTTMGIVPIGSGNGLARHLGIAMNVKLAINKALTGTSTEIDCAQINNLTFFCTAGLGFDARVAWDFAQAKSRGLFTYITCALKANFTYKPLNITIETDGKLRVVEAFTLTFANAGQYGNNAWIAPQAHIADGLLEIVLLKPYPFWQAPIIAFCLFAKTLHHSPYIEIIKAKAAQIKLANNALIHFDGEPMQLFTNDLVVNILEKKLKILI